ncbi:MAG: hypothetical protein P8J17_02325 [Halioglobus sp.]|nr:hypothetical protein [Halioglobus sp.]
MKTSRQSYINRLPLGEGDYQFLSKLPIGTMHWDTGTKFFPLVFVFAMYFGRLV